MILKTEGLVLKTYDIRETSRIAVFFTKDHGKLSGLFKGIRAKPGKFGSHLDKFSVNEFVYYHSRHADLHLVSQCDLKEYFFSVRQDYDKNVAAHYMCELVEAIMPLEQSNGKIYRLMLNFLRSLETTADIERLVAVFQIKMLLFSGFRPHIDACVCCESKIKGAARFSMKLGGLVCTRCPTREAAFIIVSQGAISSILHIEQNRWDNCVRLGLTTSIRKELRYILGNFLLYHLGRKIKAAPYLKGINRNPS